MGVKPKQRQSEIIKWVGQQGEITVDELAQKFDVSAETIRRDLGLLADSGRLRKVHGGARRLGLTTEGSFAERMSECIEAKELIAKKLARIIDPGTTLFLDTGSTTLVCAQALSTLEGLTVITNSLRIAQVIGQSGAAVHLLGGKYDADCDETIGPDTLKQITRYQADYAILSAAAIDAVAGVMDSSFEEAQVAIAMANCSNHVVILADASKFERRAAYRVCRFEHIDTFVSDKPPESGLRVALQQSGAVLH